MNIFVLSSKPAVAARMLCDAHVVKMTLESAQILSTVWRWYYPRPPKNWDEIVYASTHLRHPCVQWTMRSADNYDWLVAHALEIAAQYTQRYGKVHASETVVHTLKNAPYALNRCGHTPFVQCMPERYRVPGDPVLAYRAYYLGEKMHFAHWRHTEPPYWLPENYRR